MRPAAGLRQEHNFSARRANGDKDSLHSARPPLARFSQPGRAVAIDLPQPLGPSSTVTSPRGSVNRQMLNNPPFAVTGAQRDNRKPARDILLDDALHAQKERNAYQRGNNSYR